MPKEIITRLNTAIAKSLRAPDSQEAWRATVRSPMGHTPGEFRAHIEVDLVKWAKVIEAAGIRLEP